VEQLRKQFESLLEQQNAPAGSPQLPSVQDFLQDAQQDPSQLPSLGELLRRMPDAKDLPLSELSKLKNQAGSSNNLADSLKSSLPPQLLRDMDRNGLKKTFSDLVRDAEREASLKRALETEGPSENGLGSGVEKAFLSALDGVREGIFEKDDGASDKNDSQPSGTSAKQPAGSRPTPQLPSVAQSTSRPGGSVDTPSGAALSNQPKASSKSKSGGFFSKVSKFVNRWATGSSDGNMSAAAPAGSPSFSSSAPDLSNATPAAASALSALSAMLLPLLAACTVVAIAFWWLRRQQPQESPAIALADTAAIQTPYDIVQAFHALVRHGLPTKAEQWWNHRYTAQQLAHQTPGQQRAWQQLASLYEAARYAPTIDALAPDKIATAQQIIRQLSQSDTSGDQ
jgi:hypothetical protein